LQIEVGAIHYGAQIDFLSQYPQEGEVLFGPLSYLEVVGSPSLETYEVLLNYDVLINLNGNYFSRKIQNLLKTCMEQGEEVVIVQLRVSINLKALTIEEMLGRRKRFQVILSYY
jgi:hypothetical protein